MTEMSKQKIVELPLLEPIYSTYHNGIFSAALYSNPSHRNWYLNESAVLVCSRDFLSGYTSPKLDVKGVGLYENPNLIREWHSMRYMGGYINPFIRNLIDNGFYIYFIGIDDYYMEGKSWYKEKHFFHDGAICGYDQENKTYCIYAYDKNWIYRKFWTPQKAFNDGHKSVLKAEGQYGNICAVKPKPDIIKLSPETVYQKITEHLDSSMEKYPKEETGNVFGLVVHEYIVDYLGRLFDGTIPYERMDRRIFRLMWEHKKNMHERLAVTEDAIGMEKKYSSLYQPLVKEADSIRMLYASHHMKRRDSVLPIIQKKLLNIMEDEKRILTEFTDALAKEI